MQGRPFWNGTPSSALINDSSNQNNYFYPYHPWSRPASSYDQVYYGNHQSLNSGNSSTMRYCGDTTAVNPQPSSYHYPPQTYFRPPVYSNGHTRPRQDRIPMANQNGYSTDHMARQPKPNNPSPAAKQNQNEPAESENFSSVFTQSLTSLYSQDAEGNFVEEKTIKCEPDPSPPLPVEEHQPPMSANNNNNNTEYSFNSVFAAGGSTECAPNTFEPVKIKTEPYSGDDYSYEPFARDDMYLRNAGSLADAYKRKRKHSAPAMSYRASTTDKNKEPNLYQPQSQWIPNSVNCTNGNAQTETSAFGQPSFDCKRYGNRQPPSSFRTSRSKANNAVDVKPPQMPQMNFRPCRTKTELTESKPFQTTSKKNLKKVSPLTIYAKIIDDRVVEVTCRRFKKRTKPNTSNDSIVAQSRPLNFSHLHQKENVDDACGNVMNFILDKVSRTTNTSQSDLSTMNANEVKKLFAKLCRNYSMDVRDFQDVAEIIKPRVMSAKDKEVNTVRRRKRVKISELHETFQCEKVHRSRKTDSEVPPPEKKKNKAVLKTHKVVDTPPLKVVDEPKPTPRIGRPPKKPPCDDESPARNLRSLPSRQNAPQTTKKGKKLGKKSVENNRYPKRNLRSGNNTTTGKKLKIIIDISKDNSEKEVVEVESEGEAFNFTDEEKKINEDSADSSRDLDKHLDDDVKPQPRKTAATTVIDVESDVTVLPRISSTSDQTEDELELRQPPQLVCMGSSTNNMFVQDTPEIEMPTELKKETDARMNTDYPVTETPSNSSPPVLNVVPICSRSLSQDSDDEKLVIDMDDEDDNKEVPEPSKNTENEPKTDDVTMKDLSQNEEDSGDDDCIIVHSDNEQNITISHQPETPKPFDFLSLLPRDKKLPEVPQLQRMNVASTSKNGPKSAFMSKAEQDESILRTLLLESEAVSNSAIAKELESPEGTSQLVQNVMNLTKQDGFASLGLETMRSLNLDNLTLPQFNPELNLSPGESFIIPKFQLYPNSIKSLIPPAFEGTRNNMHATDSITSSLNLLESQEATKDPQQLKEHITKLKGEVIYLQLMLDQKEREKIAIMCLKKLKESILKRLYKNYSFGGQDLGSDWVFPKREGSSEDSRSDSHTETQSSSPRIDVVNPSPPGSVKSMSDNQRDSCPFPSLTTSHGPSASSGFTLSNSNPASFIPSNSSIPSSFIHSNSIPSSFTHSNSVPSTFTPSNSRHPHHHHPHGGPTKHGPQKTTEKVSTIETMVAKASENYGLDMTNLRERLRTSPDASGTILQKMLSTQQNMKSNSSPDHFCAASFSAENVHKRSSTMSKPPMVMLPRPYSIPLDLIMSPNSSRGSPNSLEHFRNSPDVNKPQNAKDANHRKSSRAPFRSWSIQTGSRINEDKTGNLYSKPGPIIGSPSAVSQSTNEDRMINNSFAKAGPSIRSPNSSTSTGEHRPPGGFVKVGSSIRSSSGSSTTSNGSIHHHHHHHHHRQVNSPGKPPLGRRPTPTLLNNFNAAGIGHMGDQLTARNSNHELASTSKSSSEDANVLNFSNCPALSSNSTMPFGGHIIQNSRPLTPNVKSGSSTPAPSSPPMCMGCSMSDAKYLCSGCRKQWYCSHECQTMKWPEHSRVCGPQMFSTSPINFS